MNTFTGRSTPPGDAHTATVEVDTAFDAAVLAAAEADSEAQQASAEDPWPGTGTLVMLLVGVLMVLTGGAGLLGMWPVSPETAPLIALGLLAAGAAAATVAGRRLYRYAHELAEIVD